MTPLPPLDLGERPDPERNAQILSALRSQIDQPVQLSAAHRQRIDVPLLQILLAAQVEWNRRGTAFSMIDVGPALLASLALLGVGPDQLALMPTTAEPVAQ